MRLILGRAGIELYIISKEPRCVHFFMKDTKNEENNWSLLS